MASRKATGASYITVILANNIDWQVWLNILAIQWMQQVLC